MVEKKWISGNLLAVAEVTFKPQRLSVGNTILEMLTCS